MIGYEDEPGRSAEICICEIFGSEADTSGALVGMGIHPFNDRTIRDDFTEVETAIAQRHRFKSTGSASFRPTRQVTRSQADVCGLPDRRRAGPAVLTPELTLETPHRVMVGSLRSGHESRMGADRCRQSRSGHAGPLVE